MIEMRDISLAFGARKIFDNACAVISKGERIGLVGANGAGKSTLLRILAGEEEIDSGLINKPKYATIGYLPQENVATSSRPLFQEVESSFEDITQLRKMAAHADEIISVSSTDSREYADAINALGDIQHKLEDLQECKLRSRVESVLMGLGFKLSDMNRPCGEFSGGWKMRIALAKLLLKEPTLLMLDEPTNHLDIESVTWLEDYLQGYPGAILAVSHDRNFLNLLTTRTIHVVSGKLESYSGNYDFYESQSRARRLCIERAAANQSRQIEKTERFIERFRYKASKAAQVQSRIKALDKIERILVEEKSDSVKFHFPPAKRSGDTVLDVSGVSKSFNGHPVFSNISFKIGRGERIALVGPNGAGKSTLTKIIAGELGADSGEITFGQNVEMSYFAQQQSSELDPQNDVLTEALNRAPMERKKDVRTLLGAFLFKGDDVFKKTSVLSGGEKNRLALAKILLEDFNFLVLDEPTNHLDMDSKEALQQALKSYDGSCLIVSHDVSFLDPLVNRVFELGHGGLRVFYGNASSYVEHIKTDGRISLRADNKKDKAVQPQKQRRILEAKKREETNLIKRNIREIEAKISFLEGEISNMENEMASPDFFAKGQKCSEVANAYEKAKLELSALYAKWENAQEKLMETSDNA